MQRFRPSTSILVATTILFASTLGAATGVAAPAATTGPPIIPTHLPYPTGGTTAVGTGIDAANQNAQLAETITTHLNASWKVSPPTCPSSAGAQTTSISVTPTTTVTVDTQYQCSSVSAYANTTGKLLWRSNFHFARKAQVVGSTVFVRHDDVSGGSDQLEALNLVTGKRRWTVGFSGVGTDDYRISVGSGIAVNGAVAVDANTGKLKWIVENDPDISMQSNSTVTGGRVYLNSYGRAAALDAATGRKIWTYAKTFNSGIAFSAEPPSVHAGLVYLIGSGRSLVLNAATGKAVRTLPGSDKSIAFDGNIGFFTHNGADPFHDSASIKAIDLTSGAAKWTYSYPPLAVGQNVAQQEGAPPLVENGLVWLQDSSDSSVKAKLTALDEITGNPKVVISQPCPPADPAYASIVAAQHRLYTTNDCATLTYVNK